MFESASVSFILQHQVFGWVLQENIQKGIAPPPEFIKYGNSQAFSKSLGRTPVNEPGCGSCIVCVGCRFE